MLDNLDISVDGSEDGFEDDGAPANNDDAEDDPLPAGPNRRGKHTQWDEFTKCVSVDEYRASELYREELTKKFSIFNLVAIFKTFGLLVRNVEYHFMKM